MLRKKIIGLLLLATGWTDCTQNFDEINTDPNRLEKIDPFDSDDAHPLRFSQFQL